MEKYILIVFISALSGFISGYIFDGGLNIFGFYGVGVVFGVIVGTWFLVAEKTNRLKTLFWVIASGLAYYIAVNAYAHSNEFFNQNNIPGLDVDTLSFIFAGTVGAFLLAIGTHFLIEKLRWWQILIIVLCGGIAGAYFNLDGQIGSQPFIIWQVPVGTAIGILVHRNKARVV